MPLSSVSVSNGHKRDVDMKPRLTYSSVIHTLVEQITQRSPFLRDSGETSGDNDDIALFYRDEIITGNVLGNGNFSNVFEVVGLKLREQQTIMAPIMQMQEDGEEARDNGNRHGEDQQFIRTRSQLQANTERLCVKCLKPELLENKSPRIFLEAAADLVIEAKYLTKLNHENILRIRGLAKGWESAFANGEYDSFFLLVDRLDETLNQRIKRWRAGEFPEENVMETKMDLIRQLSSALSYLADRDLLFRDCKPQNIGLAKKTDGSLSLKLFDFGFCRSLPTIDQARDDVEDTKFSHAKTLKSGEPVFLMSGKGTRRYMAPEVILNNYYNLKADVYSFAMVAWETLTLEKPYYKYTKAQHMEFVCKQGDRPPLEQPTVSLWSPSSFHSRSASLSSTHSSVSSNEASINFDLCMTEPMRRLLRQAWHQDVTARLTIKEVMNALDEIIDNQKDHGAPEPFGKSISSDVSTSSLSSTRGYSCLSAIADYGDVRNLMAEFDLPGLPFLGCFRHDNAKQQENIAPEPSTPEITIEQSETIKVNNTKHKEDTGNRQRSYNSLAQFPGSQLQTLIVQ